MTSPSTQRRSTAVRPALAPKATSWPTRSLTQAEREVRKIAQCIRAEAWSVGSETTTEAAMTLAWQRWARAKSSQEVADFVMVINAKTFRPDTAGFAFLAEAYFRLKYETKRLKIRKPKTKGN